MLTAIRRLKVYLGRSRFLMKVRWSWQPEDHKTPPGNTRQGFCRVKSNFVITETLYSPSNPKGISFPNKDRDTERELNIRL